MDVFAVSTRMRRGGGSRRAVVGYRYFGKFEVTVDLSDIENNTVGENT